MGDTFDELFGPDPTAVRHTMAGPGTSLHTVPAAVDSNLTGLSSLHPGKSPTPWVIGMALVLVLLLHPKAGFGGNVNARVG